MLGCLTGISQTIIWNLVQRVSKYSELKNIHLLSPLRGFDSLVLMLKTLLVTYAVANLLNKLFTLNKCFQPTFYTEQILSTSHGNLSIE